MLFSALVHFFFGAVTWIIDLIALPFAAFSLPEGTVSTLVDIMRMVDFFIPVGALAGIVLAASALEMALLTWRIVLRIKSFIPLISGN